MSKKLRTVFLGTPEFAVPVLEALARETEVALVVSQPDRPKGRGRKLTPPPVKVAALRLGIDVIQPNIVKGRRFAVRIAEYDPDFVITAAFGRLLGPSLLGTPKKNSLNVHASLLPRLRGAAPVNWAILRGDTETGVSIMKMEEGLDSGPVYRMVKTKIHEQETAGELTLRLAHLGAEALIETLRCFDDLEAVSQDHDKATWAPILKKKDGRINWDRSVRELHCHVRGMSPWPSASTVLNGKPLKVHVAKVLRTDKVEWQPGQIAEVTDKGIDVACRDGVLRLEEIQVAGRKRLRVAEFLGGSRLKPGIKLGE